MPGGDEADLAGDGLALGGVRDGLGVGLDGLGVGFGVDGSGVGVGVGVGVAVAVAEGVGEAVAVGVPVGAADEDALAETGAVSAGRMTAMVEILAASPPGRARTTAAPADPAAPGEQARTAAAQAAMALRTVTALRPTDIHPPCRDYPDIHYGQDPNQYIVSGQRTTLATFRALRVAQAQEDPVS